MQATHQVTPPSIVVGGSKHTIVHEPTLAERPGLGESPNTALEAASGSLADARRSRPASSERTDLVWETSMPVTSRGSRRAARRMCDEPQGGTGRVAGRGLPRGRRIPR